LVRSLSRGLRFLTFLLGLFERSPIGVGGRESVSVRVSGRGALEAGVGDGGASADIEEPKMFLMAEKRELMLVKKPRVGVVADCSGVVWGSG
jgi:hypothetical protein